MEYVILKMKNGNLDMKDATLVRTHEQSHSLDKKAAREEEIRQIRSTYNSLLAERKKVIENSKKQLIEVNESIQKLEALLRALSKEG